MWQAVGAGSGASVAGGVEKGGDCCVSGAGGIGVSVLCGAAAGVMHGAGWRAVSWRVVPVVSVSDGAVVVDDDGVGTVVPVDALLLSAEPALVVLVVALSDLVLFLRSDAGVVVLVVDETLKSPFGV